MKLVKIIHLVQAEKKTNFKKLSLTRSEHRLRQDGGPSMKSPLHSTADRLTLSSWN